MIQYKFYFIQILNIKYNLFFIYFIIIFTKKKYKHVIMYLIKHLMRYFTINNIFKVYIDSHQT